MIYRDMRVKLTKDMDQWWLNVVKGDDARY